MDAIKAIYEREMAKQGLPAVCDETKLAEIVRNVEQIIPPGVEIEYISGEEIRKETAEADQRMTRNKPLLPTLSRQREKVWSFFNTQPYPRER